MAFSRGPSLLLRAAQVVDGDLADLRLYREKVVHPPAAEVVHPGVFEEFRVPVLKIGRIRAAEDGAGAGDAPQQPDGRLPVLLRDGVEEDGRAV